MPLRVDVRGGVRSHNRIKNLSVSLWLANGLPNGNTSTNDDDTKQDQFGSERSDEQSSRMDHDMPTSSISLASSFAEGNLVEDDQDDQDNNASNEQSQPLSTTTTGSSLYGYGNNSCDTSLEQSFFEDSGDFSTGYKISPLDGGNAKTASVSSIHATSNDDSVDYGYGDQQSSYSVNTDVQQPPQQEQVTAVPLVQTCLHQSLHGTSGKKKLSSCKKSRRHRRRSIATTSNVEQEVQSSSSKESSSFYQRGSMSQELQAWEQETGWGNEPTPSKAAGDDGGSAATNKHGYGKDNNITGQGVRYSKHSTHGDTISKTSISSSASDRRRQRRASIATSAPTNLPENDYDDNVVIIKQYPKNYKQPCHETEKNRRKRRGRRYSLSGSVQNEQHDVVDDSIADMSGWDEGFLTSYNSILTKHSGVSNRTLNRSNTNIPSVVPIRKEAPIPATLREPDHLKTGWTDNEDKKSMLSKILPAALQKASNHRRRRRRAGRRNSIGTSVPSEKHDLVDDSISDLSMWTESDNGFLSSFSTLAKQFSSKSLLGSGPTEKLHDPLSQSGHDSSLQTGWTDDEGDALSTMSMYSTKTMKTQDSLSPSKTTSNSKTRRGGRRKDFLNPSPPHDKGESESSYLSDAHTGWTDDENDYLKVSTISKYGYTRNAPTLEPTPENPRRNRRASMGSGVVTTDQFDLETGWTDDEGSSLGQVPFPTFSDSTGTPRRSRRGGRRASMGASVSSEEVPQKSKIYTKMSLDKVDNKALDYLGVTRHRLFGWNKKPSKEGKQRHGQTRSHHGSRRKSIGTSVHAPPALEDDDSLFDTGWTDKESSESGYTKADACPSLLLCS